MSLAAIHILKNDLGLCEADYRNLLYDVAGVASAKQLDEAGDRAVMARMYAIRDARAQAVANAPKTRQEGKIWALWYELASLLPKPEQRNPHYLAGIVKHFGPVVEDGNYIRFHQLTSPQAKKAIDALTERIKFEREKLTDEVPF